jgi:RNA polymerase sigma factor for flagellar operon FliA
MEIAVAAELEMQVLWRAFARSRDTRLREKLIVHYSPLARMAAVSAYGLRRDNSLVFDDYLQYARVGLIESVDNYDPNRGTSFKSFSAYRIRGAILNGLIRESEAAAQYSFWKTRLQERTTMFLTESHTQAREASLSDIAELAVNLAIGLLIEVEEGEIVDQTVDANPYASRELGELQERMREHVSCLPDREQRLVRRHYFEHVEFQEIAREMGITKGRVSQLHSQALKRIRAAMSTVQQGLDRKL